MAPNCCGEEDTLRSRARMAPDGSVSYGGESHQQHRHQEKEGQRTKEKEPAKIKWLPLLMLLFMFGAPLLGGLVFVYDAIVGGGEPAFATEEARQRNRWCQETLLGIYKTHNTAKVVDIPNLCQKYRGREQALVRRVSNKYEGERED